MKNIEEIRQIVESLKTPLIDDKDTIPADVFEYLKTINDKAILNSLVASSPKSEDSKYCTFNVEFICPNCGQKKTVTITGKTNLINMVYKNRQSIDYGTASYGLREGEYWCQDCMAKLGEEKYQEYCIKSQEEKIQREIEMKRENERFIQEVQLNQMILQKWFRVPEDEINENDYSFDELLADFSKLESRKYYEELFYREWDNLLEPEETIYYKLCQAEAEKKLKHKCEISGLETNLIYIYFGDFCKTHRSIDSFHCININVFEKYGKENISAFFDMESEKHRGDIHGIRETCMFGKYKGTQFGEILRKDPQYLRWYKENANHDFNIIDTDGNLLL